MDFVNTDCEGTAIPLKIIDTGFDRSGTLAGPNTPFPNVNDLESIKKTIGELTYGANAIPGVGVPVASGIVYGINHGLPGCE